MATRSEHKPVLITSAERSPDDQLHSRQVRYVIMMGSRIVLLVLATVLVAYDVPLLWLWVTLCVAGGALLPWVAVLIANDRPPKEEHRLGSHLHRAPPAEEPKALPERRHTIVEHDE